MTAPELNDKFWDQRYLTHATGWDVGEIAEPIKMYVNQLVKKDIAILIPGCGNAYEALYLLDNGFSNITLVDISPLLVKSLKEKLKRFIGRGLEIICGDFFMHQGKYDLIIEQTFFCALDPMLRSDYAIKMKELLNQSGKLVGLLFDRSFVGGPPFGGSEGEFRKLFSPYFRLKTMERCYNSIEPRKGSELFFILEKNNYNNNL